LNFTFEFATDFEEIVELSTIDGSSSGGQLGEVNHILFLLLVWFGLCIHHRVLLNAVLTGVCLFLRNEYAK
jgi:hypothetical protein